MDADLEVYGWNQWHVGPWLRGERVKRSYNKFFDPKNRNSTWLKYQFAKRFGNHQVSYERKGTAADVGSQFHVLNNPWIEGNVGYNADQFQGLRGHEAVVRQGLMDMIRPKYRRLIEQAPAPELAVHVRRGDYKLGDRYVTPDSLFIEAIRSIRESRNEDIPVTIFSDAWPTELENLLSLPNVQLGKAQPDIVDLLQMSKSKFLVTSDGSTFGFWAGYLSHAAIILNERHASGRIRSEQSPYFEGTIDQFCKS